MNSDRAWTLAAVIYDVAHKGGSIETVAAELLRCFPDAPAAPMAGVLGSSDGSGGAGWVGAPPTPPAGTGGALKKGDRVRVVKAIDGDGSPRNLLAPVGSVWTVRKMDGDGRYFDVQEPSGIGLRVSEVERLPDAPTSPAPYAPPEWAITKARSILYSMGRRDDGHDVQRDDLARLLVKTRDDALWDAARIADKQGWEETASLILALRGKPPRKP